MQLNRTIKLTKPIRQEIARKVRGGWLKEHPRPEMPQMPSGQQLQRLADWKAGQERMEREVFQVLETFASVNQLQELWPEVMPFVSLALIDPSKYATIPKAA